ncbi:hypothetical protein IB270_29330 [Ensifer sp. ENS05]|uniref:hypothetical protein n=1 Tax=Ensifer sp. ENS05 TaxID=2769277 RepID=UPI00177F7D18|nr:hypothetical protein [Ensifer sp. ENS05]MBD9596938.1 hypothetical protein [Ensifer sp. ENS05]
MAKPTKKAASDTGATRNGVPPIAISGEFASQVSIVSSTSMTVFVGVGELEDEKQVLVPLVSWGVAGSRNAAEPEGPSSLHSSLLTLENAAFVAFDVADELRQVLSQLTTITSGGIKLEPERLKTIAHYLERAESAIELCRSNTQKLLDLST